MRKILAAGLAVAAIVAATPGVALAKKCPLSALGNPPPGHYTYVTSSRVTYSSGSYSSGSSRSSHYSGSYSR